jgi:hypothetical protein
LRDAKQAALNSKELPAKAIVEPLLYKLFKSNKKFLLPKIENWCRVVNRFKEDERPPNPPKIDFELVKKVLPKEFEVHDINSKKLGRALVFFTEHQMELLKRAKRWFLDGTFRIAKSPFMQLWSIHAMIRVKNEMKQVPLAFVLMSRRTRRDYEKVLKLIYEVIFLKRARVVEVVCDFEKAVWQAVHLVLPFVQVKGCGFHWTQCLFRQLKKLGLVSAYRSDKNVKILCKQVLCLHLLPVCKIENAFFRLLNSVPSVTNDRDTQKLL